MIVMEKILIRSNRYVFEGGGVIIKNRTNVLRKKKYSKRQYSVIQFTFLCQDIVGTLIMSSNPKN